MKRAPLLRFNFASVFWILILGAMVAPVFLDKKVVPPPPVPRKADVPMPVVVQKAPASISQLDTDGDGMPDAWEIANHLNPNDPSDRDSDFDLDGVTAIEEYNHGTNPNGVWSVNSFAAPADPDATWSMDVHAVSSSGLALIQFQKTSPTFQLRWFILNTDPSYSGSRWTEITPSLGAGYYANMLDINDSGTVVFERLSTTPGNTDAAGYIRQPNGTLQALVDSSGQALVAERLNNSNEWVGYKVSDSSPVYFRDGVLAHHTVSTWLNYDYCDINDFGEILGTCLDSTSIAPLAFLDMDGMIATQGIPAAPPFGSSTDVVWAYPEQMNSYGDYAGQTLLDINYSAERSFSYDGKLHAWSIGADIATGLVFGMDDLGRVLIENGFSTGYNGGILAVGNQAVAVKDLVPGLPQTGWAPYSGGLSTNGTIILANNSLRKIYTLVSNQDQDGDGMSDDWETIHGLNPNDPRDAYADADGDGLSNLMEYRLGRNPNISDNTAGPPPDLRDGIDDDGDGIPNTWEWQHGLNYLDPSDATSTPLNNKTDPDRDGYSNLQEYLMGTDPHGAPSFQTNEVGQIAGATAAQFSPQFLGAVGTSDQLIFQATSASGTGPACWVIPAGGLSQQGLFYNNPLVSGSSILAASPSGAVASTVNGSSGALAFWRTTTSTPSTIVGDNSASGSNTLQFYNSSLSPAGVYMTGARTLRSTSAYTGFLWKMPPANSSSFDALPMALTLPGTMSTIDWSTARVNDTGFVIANGTSTSGLARSVVWIPPAGSGNPTPVLLGTIGSGTTTSVKGLSNTSAPILVGSATTGSGSDYHAVTWACSTGVATDLAVNPGTVNEITSISDSEQFISGTWKNSSGTTPSSQAFIGRRITGGWQIVPQGPVQQSVIVSSVNGWGEAFGKSQSLSSAPLLPTLWRSGAAFALDKVLPAGYTLGSIISCNENGSLLVTATKAGMSMSLILTPNSDTDGDGMPDSYEIANGLNPFSAEDAAQDADGDGLSNLAEFRLGTNPQNKDTDGDGMDDKWEIDWGLNPTDATDAYLDPDGDGVTNIREYALSKASVSVNPTGVYRTEIVPLAGQEYFTNIAEDGAIVTFQPGVAIYDWQYQLIPGVPGWGYQWRGILENHTTRSTVSIPFGDWDPGPYGGSGEYHSTTVYPYGGGQVAGVHTGYSTSNFSILPHQANLFLFDANAPSADGILQWSNITGGLTPSTGWGTSVSFLASSPRGTRFAIQNTSLAIQVIDPTGTKTDDLPYQNPLPGYTSVNWVAMNNSGDSLGLLLPGNQLAWRIANSATITPIAEPSDWGTDAWGLGFTVLTDDQKTVLYHNKIGVNGALVKERYLLDLGSGTVSLISYPGLDPNESIVSVASNGRILGSTGSRAWIVSNGSTFLLDTLRTTGSTGTSPAQTFSQLGYSIDYFDDISSDGRITLTVHGADNQPKILILTPDQDHDKNSIPDDYEAEVKHFVSGTETALDLNIDHDGDGYTLAQELAAGTSDSSADSKPGGDSATLDSDGDGIPDNLDADPKDPAINWRRPDSATKFSPVKMQLFGDLVGSPLDLTTKSVRNNTWSGSSSVFSAQSPDDVQIIDVTSGGDILYGEGSYSVAATGAINYPHYHIAKVVDRQDVRLSGLEGWKNGSINYGFSPRRLRSNYHVEGRLQAWPDEDFEGDWPFDMNNPWVGYGQAGSIVRGVQFTEDMYDTHSFDSQDRHAWVRVNRDDDLNWTSSDVVVSDTETGAERKKNFPVIGSGGAATSPISGMAHMTEADLCPVLMPDLQHIQLIDFSLNPPVVRAQQIVAPRGEPSFRGVFGAARLKINHKDGGVETRDLVSTGLGMWVARDNQAFELAKRGAGVNYLTRQGWIVSDNGIWMGDGGGTRSWTSVIDSAGTEFYGTTDSHGVVTGRRKISVTQVLNATEGGLITVLAECTPDSGTGPVTREIFNLTPIEIKTDTSSVVSHPAAPVAAPDDFRKISLNGVLKKEAKPEGDTESDLSPENTYVDNYTRYLRYDTSHVYQKVPASDLALQAGMTWDGDPIEVPSGSMLPQTYTGTNAAAELQASRLLEMNMQGKVGLFGAGWSTNLGASATVEVKVRQPKSDDVGYSSGYSSASKVFLDSIRAKIVDESGRVLEFASGNLVDFYPLPSRFPQKNDTGMMLKRIGAGTSSDHLELRKKFGTVCSYQWSSTSVPQINGLTLTLQDATTYTAPLASVTDRYGNQVTYTGIGGGSFKIGAPGRHDVGLHDMAFTYHVSSITGVAKHVPFTLIDSVTDAMGNVTRFAYDWRDILGAEVPVLSKVTKADGSVQRYDYTSSVGSLTEDKEARFLEELKKQNSQPVNPIAKLEPTKQLTVDDLKVLSSQLHSLYCHLNLVGITNPAGATWKIAYESSPQNDLLHVQPSVTAAVSNLPPEAGIGEIPDSAALVSDATISAIRDNENASILNSAAEIYTARGGSELKSTDTSIAHTGYFAMPAVEGADVVKAVTLPNGTGCTISSDSTGGTPAADTTDSGHFTLDRVDPSFPGMGAVRKAGYTKVVDANNDLTEYVFNNPILIATHVVPATGQNIGDATGAFVEGHVRNDSGKTLIQMVGYGGISIISHDHTGALAPRSVSYAFDPSASMALSQTTDANGNTIYYEHDDTLPATDSSSNLFGHGDTWDLITPSGTRSVVFNKFPEPARERQGAYTRSFTYDTTSRRMTSSTDRRGNKTVDVIQNGLRTSEKIFQGDDVTGTLLSSQTFEYGNTTFPAFMTKSTVLKFAVAVPDESWVKERVTINTPDLMGHVGSSTVVNPDAADMTTTTVYDAGGRKTKVTDPLGYFTQFAYDPMGRLAQVTYPHTAAGTATKTFAYDAAGHKVRETDELGHSTLWSYDLMGRATATWRHMTGVGLSDSSDLVTTTVYNNLGMPVKVTDPNGNITTIAYDAFHRAVQQVDATGGVTQMYYGVNSGSGLDNAPADKPTRTRNPRGFVTINTYDGFYRPTYSQVEYKLPDTVPNPDNWATRTPAADRSAMSGNVYDPDGNAIEQHKYRSGAASGSEIFTANTFDALNRPVTTTAGSGTSLANTTHAYYSSTGLKWKTVAYEGIGNLERTTSTEYDAAGRLVKVWSPHPGSGSVVKTGTDPSACVQTAYDKNSNPTVVTDALGYVATSYYDERNRVIQVKKAAAPVYDPSTGFTPSAESNIYESYDLVGKPMSVTDARGHITYTDYDNANRPTTVTAAYGTPLAAVTSTQYDKNGNVIAVIDANSAVTRNLYDGLNRLTASAVNPVTGLPSANFALPNSGDVVVINQYDASGNLILTGDGESVSWSYQAHTTNFTYDGLNRKISQTWDNSWLLNSQKWNYDAVALTSAVNARNQTTSYAYDALLRPSGESYGAVATDNTTRIYQGAATYIPGTAYTSGPGPMVGIEHPNAAAADRIYVDTSNTYDRCDRPASETSGGEKHLYDYDIAGNPVMVTYAKTGRSLVTRYDVAGRVNQIIDTVNTVTTPRTYTAQSGDLVTQYGYDIGGLVLLKSLPNSTSTFNTYDARNRLLVTVTRRIASGGNVDLSKFDYSQPQLGSTAWSSGYDGLGNVLCVHETYSSPVTSRVVQNTYDWSNRLAVENRTDNGQVTSTSYQYDRANNRRMRIVSLPNGTTETTRYNTGNPTINYTTNQLYGISKVNVVPSVDTDYKVRYVYDADGNRSQRITDPGTASAQVDTYTYDQRSRLTQIARGPVAPATTTVYHAYTYDERTRRTRTVESGTTRRLSFSGGTYVQEYSATTGTQPTSELVRGSDLGGGVGGILYTKPAGSAAMFENYNSRGDLVGQTNGSGGVEFQTKYEAFGTHLDTGTATGRQRANSKDEDPTGLLNEGMRYRDLDAGIFLTRDPAGLVDGPNTYTYVKQNPWTAWDPTGLEGIEQDDSNMSDQDLVNWETQGDNGAYMLNQHGEDRINQIKKEFQVDDIFDLKGLDIESEREVTRESQAKTLETIDANLTRNIPLDGATIGPAPLPEDWTLTRALGSTFHSDGLAELNAQLIGGALQEALAAKGLTYLAAVLKEGKIIQVAETTEAVNTGRKFGAAEQRVADYIEEVSGLKSTPNLEEGVAGAGRQGDAIIAGVKHEFKTLDPGATANTIRNAVSRSIKGGGQAREIVIDARGSGLTRDVAQQGMFKALGASRGLLDGVTTIGDDFFIRYSPR